MVAMEQPADAQTSTTNFESPAQATTDRQVQYYRLFLCKNRTCFKVIQLLTILKALIVYMFINIVNLD